jgi:hypothetical protein
MFGWCPREHGRPSPARLTFLARWPTWKATQHAGDRIWEITSGRAYESPAEWIVKDFNRFPPSGLHTPAGALQGLAERHLTPPVKNAVCRVRENSMRQRRDVLPALRWLVAGWGCRDDWLRLVPVVDSFLQCVIFLSRRVTYRDAGGDRTSSRISDHGRGRGRA